MLRKTCAWFCRELFLLFPCDSDCAQQVPATYFWKVSSCWTSWAYNSNRPTFKAQWLAARIRVWRQTWARPIGRIILAHWTDTPTSCNGLRADTWPRPALQRKSLFLIASGTDSKGNRGYYGKYSILFYSFLFVNTKYILYSLIINKYNIKYNKLLISSTCTKYHIHVS